MGRLLDALKQFDAQEADAAERKEDAAEESPDSPDSLAENAPPAGTDAANAPPSSQDVSSKATQLLCDAHAAIDEDLYIPGVQATDEGAASREVEKTVATDAPIVDGSEIDVENVAADLEPDKGNAATRPDENTGHALIDNLKATIQCELDREEADENDESSSVSVEFHFEATDLEAATGPESPSVVSPARAEPEETDQEETEDQLAAGPIVEHETASSVPADVTVEAARSTSQSVDAIELQDAGDIEAEREQSPTQLSTIESAVEFGQLAKNVLAQWKDKKAPTLLVAPAEPAGNITSIVVQLGHALSQCAGGAILVFGADRAADATLNLGGGQPSQWTDILTGEANWREKIRPTGIPGLDLVSAPITTALAERRGPEQLGALLSEMCGGYRMVLIDGSGLETEELATLASCCAGVYLVVRLRHTDEKTAKATLKRLRAADARVVGCIAAGTRR